MKGFLKRIVPAALALWFIPALSLAQARIGFTALESGDNRVVLFYAQEQMEDTQEAETTETQSVSGIISALCEERFFQGRAAQIYAQASARGGLMIEQRESLYQTEDIASMGLLWHGIQPDGLDGSSAYGLTVDLKTGEELTFSDLFKDPDEAAAVMETIIEREIASGLSDYLEFADLLPMPREIFWFDEGGFTVGYPDSRYRYFSGHSGTVHFAWHELADAIGEDSPLYALSRPQPADADAIYAALVEGKFGGTMPFGVGDRLGDALEALTLLTEPDYARDAGMGDSFRVYLFEESALRGWALEIPLYADTSEEETPISGVRASRIDWHGLMTGKTTREEIISLLGQPAKTLVYDAQKAQDAMMEAGESLVYPSDGGAVLYAHVDETGVLCSLTIRDGLPKDLPSWLY